MPQNVRHILIMAAINGYEALSKKNLYNIKDEKINDNFFYLNHLISQSLVCII